MAASEGDRFIFAHPDNKGYGEDAKGEQLTAEMTELDLKDGMEVGFLQYDDAGWALVEWTDDKGIERITAIDPDTFTYFIPQAGRNDL
jgi:hypothetical protein